MNGKNSGIWRRTVTALLCLAMIVSMMAGGVLVRAAEPDGTAPAETDVPAETADPAASAAPAETAAPTETPDPDATAGPDATEEPTETAEPTATAEPVETEDPDATAEPTATTGPTATAEPTEKPSQLTAAELDAIIGNGIDLSALQNALSGIAPIDLSGEKVDPKYFRFVLMSANEAEVNREFASFADLSDAGLASGSWSGPASGVNPSGTGAAEQFPWVNGYILSSVRINGTSIGALGSVTVTLSEGEKTYVYFSAINETGKMSSVVLSRDTYINPPIEVRYVPTEYQVHYQVYVDGSPAPDEAQFSLDAIFGDHRATTTVDRWFGVDVSIPQGYTGRVYIGNSTDFESDAYKKDERFPQEADYGHYGLGIAPTYELTGNTASATAKIEVKIGRNTPPYYTLTGSYDSRTGNLAAAAQTVRVELTKKQTVTFSAELWKDMKTGGTDASAQTVKKVTVEDGWTVETEPELPISWIFTTSPNHVDVINEPTVSLELRSMQLNGAELNIPFISNPTESTADIKRSAVTTLPSGAKVTLTVGAVQTTDTNGETRYVRQYKLDITGATRDVVVTGGSLTTGKKEYKELVVSTLYGVKVQAWSKANQGTQQTPGWWDLQPGQALNTGTGGNYLGGVLAGTNFNFRYDAAGMAETGEDLSGNIRFQLEEGYNFAGGEPEGTAAAPTIVLRGKNAATASEATAGGYDKCPLTVTGPDSEGWYYTTLQNLYATNEEGTKDTCNIYLLEAQAPLMSYLVVYQDGMTMGRALNHDLTGTITGMPGVTSGYYLDDNNGNYYSAVAGAGNYSGGEGSSKITVLNAQLKNEGPERPASFNGWVVTDRDGNPYKWDARNRRFARGEGGRPAYAVDPDEYLIIAPTDQVDLLNIRSAATLYSGEQQNFALYFTAWWEIGSPPFSYYVTFNYTDAAGEKHIRVGGGGKARSFTISDIVAGSLAGVKTPYTISQYYMAKRESYFKLDEDLTGLTIAYDRNAEDAEALLSGPWKWLEYDDEANHGYLWSNVPNGGEVAVWFKSKLGRLTVSKTIAGEVDDHDTAFTFNAVFTLPEDKGDDVKAFFGTGEPYSVLYTVKADDGETEHFMTLTKTAEEDNKYTGTFTIRGGESAGFDLPDGTDYEITEDLAGLEDLYSIAAADGTKTGTVVKATPENVSFTNTPTGVDVIKTQQVGDGIPTTGPLTMDSDDTVTYEITVHNRSSSDSLIGLTVTDQVPEGLEPDKDTITSGGGIYEEHSRTITWKEENVGPNREKKFSFKAKADLSIDSRRDVTNRAEAVYTWNEEQKETPSNEVELTALLDWLRIEKTVSPQGSALEEDFTFTVNMQAPAGSFLAASYPCVGQVAAGYEGRGVTAPTYTTLEVSDGKLSFTLKEGQAIVIYGLPEGMTYSVRETLADGQRYAQEATSASGTTGAAGSGDIDFNRKDAWTFENTRLGRLFISKRVVGRDSAQTFTLPVSFTLPDTAPDFFAGEGGGYTVGYTVFGTEHTLELTPAPAVGRTYSGTLELKGGERAVFDLPDGTEYTVSEDLTEVNASLTGGSYESDLEGGPIEGTVSYGASSSVMVVNTYTFNKPVTASMPAFQKGFTDDSNNTAFSLKAIMNGDYDYSKFSGDHAIPPFEFRMALDPASPKDGITMPDVLTAGKDDVNVTVTGNGKTGLATVQFPEPITFTKPGVYIVDVWEVEPETHHPTMVYDARRAVVTFTVSETADGGLAPTSTVKVNGKVVAKPFKFENDWQAANIISFEKSASPTVVFPGQEVMYTLRLVRRETSAVKDVVITDHIPGGMTFVRDSVTASPNLAGVTVEIVGQELTVRIDRFKDDLEGTITYRATAPAVMEVESWTNYAEMVYGNPSRVYDFSTLRASATVYAPHVTVEKTQQVGGAPATRDPITVNAGDVVTYAITVTNHDTVNPAGPLTVTDKLPAGMELVGGSITGGGNYDGGTVTWTIDTLAPRASETLIFQAKVPAAGGGIEFSNKAMVRFDTAPSDHPYTISSEPVIAVHEGPRELLVTETVKGEFADRNQEFWFTVALEDKSFAAERDGVSFSGGVARFPLKDGESKFFINLPKSGYTVTCEEVPGYSIDSRVREGTISDELSVAAFVHTYDLAPVKVSFPELEKTLKNGTLAGGDFSFTMTVTPAQGAELPAARTMTNDGEGKVTFGDITFTEPGIYTVEVRELPGGQPFVARDPHVYSVIYTVTNDKAGKLTAAVSRTEGSSTFTNTDTLGTLTVTNKVIGDEPWIEADAEYPIAVTFTLPADREDTTGDETKYFGSFPYEAGYALNGADEKTLSLSWDEENSQYIGILRLKADQSASFVLPAGTEYEVSETPPVGFAVKVDGAPGAVDAGGNDVVTVTNTAEAGALAVSKTVEGAGGEKERDFHFAVTLRDGEEPFSGTFTDDKGQEVKFESGMTEFDLCHGETKRIVGLPVGLKYKVEEEPVSGYTVTKSNEEGEIAVEETAVSITNTAAGSGGGGGGGGGGTESTPAPGGGGGGGTESTPRPTTGPSATPSPSPDPDATPSPSPEPTVDPSATPSPAPTLGPGVTSPPFNTSTPGVQPTAGNTSRPSHTQAPGGNGSSGSGNGPTAPLTGDGTAIVSFAAMFGLSLAGLAAVVLGRRKGKRR